MPAEASSKRRPPSGPTIVRRLPKGVLWTDAKIAAKINKDEGENMFALEMGALINRVACELVRQGRPQRDALFLVTDPRKRAELEAVLEAARQRHEDADLCAASAA